MSTKSRYRSAIAAVSVATLAATTPTFAQEAAKQAAFAPEEIIVTARKRQESIMKAPVVMQAITSQQMADLKITDFKQLSSVTPGLQITLASAATGAYVYLRGLGNGGAAVYGDQSVLLNLDGQSLTHGAFYRTGMFDIAQVEVMKGPQALFFGRSSSAGIVAVTSADPTSTWQTKITTGYEFSADELQIDGFVAGPITDKLGIRIAGYHNESKGWMKNANPTNPGRLGGDENAARLTLKYDDPDIGLRAKLKASVAKVKTDLHIGEFGQGICFGATRVNAGYPYDNCKADTFGQGSGKYLPYNPNVDWKNSFGNAAAFATGSSEPLFSKGPREETLTKQISLNIDYDLTEGLTLTSVTGAIFLESFDTLRAGIAGGPGVGLDFDLATLYSQSDMSQELRLTSDWKDSWINFILGGFYNFSGAKNHTGVGFPAFTIAYADDAKVSTRVKSAFGQVQLTPIDQFELDAGVRFTDVKKSIPVLSYQPNLYFAYDPATVGNVAPRLSDAITKFHEKNWSPEVTLSWRPNDEITTFVSWKRGYKGPGLNADLFEQNYIPSDIGYYRGEKVDGFEGGVKAQFLDRRLSVTASAYTYNYKDLQVSFTSGTTFQTNVANGANARVKGIELAGTYTPPGLEGLTLNGAVNLNSSKYTSFPNGPCYGGQQFSGDGRCVDINPDPAIVSLAQDFSGRTLAKAPKWTGQFGFVYRADITDEYSGSLMVNSNFSSSYQTTEQLNPLGFQKSWITFDATARFGKLEGPWEVALIARNITNKIILASSYDDGGSFGTPGDVLAYIHRPRQVMIQLTVRPEF